MEPKDSKGKLGDILKTVVSTGVNAAFMTEEAVKGLLQDLPLPKEMVSGLVDNAKATKTEFIASIKNELKSYLDKVDLSKEIDRIVENYDFEIQAKVSLKRKKKKDSSSDGE